MTKPKVLVVEDEERSRTVIAEYLKDFGFLVCNPPRSSRFGRVPFD